MARPLRILWEGGWYHITSRGQEQGSSKFNVPSHRTEAIQVGPDFGNRILFTAERRGAELLGIVNNALGPTGGPGGFGKPRVY